MEEICQACQRDHAKRPCNCRERPSYPRLPIEPLGVQPQWPSAHINGRPAAELHGRAQPAHRTMRENKRVSVLSHWGGCEALTEYQNKSLAGFLASSVRKSLAGHKGVGRKTLFHTVPSRHSPLSSARIPRSLGLWQEFHRARLGTVTETESTLSAAFLLSLEISFKRCFFSLSGLKNPQTIERLQLGPPAP